MIDKLFAAIERNPVRFASAFAIAINVAVSFGLSLTAEQVVGLNTLLMAVLMWLLPDKVTPVAAPQLPTGTIVNADAGAPTEIR